MWSQNGYAGWPRGPKVAPLMVMTARRSKSHSTQRANRANTGRPSIPQSAAGTCVSSPTPVLRFPLMTPASARRSALTPCLPLGPFRSQPRRGCCLPPQGACSAAALGLAERRPRERPQGTRPAICLRSTNPGSGPSHGSASGGPGMRCCLFQNRTRFSFFLMTMRLMGWPSR